MEGKEKGSFIKGLFSLTNLVRFRINDPSATYEIVYARACIVHTDEYLLGTKGSQLPSYVPCHAHYRLYNPSCDVTLFNPFITEPLRSLSFSSPLAILCCVQLCSHAKRETDQECAPVWSLGIQRSGTNIRIYLDVSNLGSGGKGASTPRSSLRAFVVRTRKRGERIYAKLGRETRFRGANARRATYRRR